MVDFVNGLSIRECLVYKNSTWNLIEDWFKTTLKSANESISNKEMISKFLSEELNEFLEKDWIMDQSLIQIKSNKLAKLFLVLFDSGEELIYKNSLQFLLDKLTSCNKYLYMKAEVTEKCFFIFNSILSQIQSKIEIITIFSFMTFLTHINKTFL